EAHTGELFKGWIGDPDDHVAVAGEQLEPDHVVSPAARRAQPLDHLIRPPARDIAGDGHPVNPGLESLSDPIDGTVPQGRQPIERPLEVGFDLIARHLSLPSDSARTKKDPRQAVLGRRRPTITTPPPTARHPARPTDRPAREVRSASTTKNASNV